MKTAIFIARVTSPAGIPTSGTVTFKDGSNVLGSADLIPCGAGVAYVTTSTLSKGTHSIMAVYSGNSNFNGGTFVALIQTVR